MTDYPWAYIGAKVVCVNDSANIDGLFRGSRWLPDDDLPIIGHEYEIESVWVDDDGDIVIECIGLHRGPTISKQWGTKCGYNIRRFRPLHTIESDAELFRAALTPTTDDIVYENALALLDEAERELEDAWKNGR